MTAIWSSRVVATLTRTDACPRCDQVLRQGICVGCSTDVSGAEGHELWRLSLAAAELIRERQAFVDELPRAVRALEPVAVRVAERALTSSAAPRSESLVSVQSVLAIAGAALVAIAAFVFTFLNPDLTDTVTRSLIVGGVTLLFLGSAWLLARAGLQFSAEAVGALGLVFVALDVQAIGGGWAGAALATLLFSAALIGLSALARIRSWLFAGLLGVAVAPALLGYAGPGPWSSIAGHVSVAFAALALGYARRRLAARFDGVLGAERTAASILQVLVVSVVLGQLAAISGMDATSRALGTAAALAALAGLAALAARVELATFWNGVAGALGTAAVAVVPLAWVASEWLPTALPVAASLALVGVARLRAPRPALVGASLVAVVATLPALMLGIQLVALPGNPLAASLEATLGLAALAAACFVVSRLTAIREYRTVGVWVAVGAVLTVIQWTALPHLAQLALGLLLAIALALASRRMTPAAPFAIGAHVALYLVAVLAWTDDSSVVWTSAIVIAALAVVARSVPARARVIHLGIGYAYALVIFATAIVLRGEEFVVVLALTTSVASATALVATLVRRVSARAWRTILLVTIVPFVLGVISVLIDIRGWTGFSTAVTFALALTLVFTTRPGLNALVRTAAAALLVPALAVVVICVGAWRIEASASPITLPIIAGIVALALPLTGWIARTLARRRLPSAQAREVRTWIEVSALLTAAIAVLLSLVRVAAGLETTLLVLAIVGLGATATGLFSRRRYAWFVAAVAFTGALWSALAIASITELEPYLLPPALAAALLGAIGVLRGLPTVRLYSTGLAIALAAPLLTLAVDGGTLWRPVAVLAASVALLGLARVLPALRQPTLVLAIAAAGAGALQALRIGFTDSGSLAILPALGFSVVAAVLAAVAGRMLVASTRSRWVYAPALGYLVAGPIVAVRVDLLAAWLLWTLSIALLGLLVVTASRARDTSLPPVWFTFALAWGVAVAGWSTREWFRVEAFSLPLGIALLVAGVIVLRRPRPATATLSSWPVGYRGSWHLLVPGLVVALGPSMLATLTDPQTWRAILVIALALVAILVGSLRRLAAPFILGVIVLPIENVLVFSVQIGRQIEAAPWWITLATAGAALLIIAATYERRGVGGTGARLRDLT